MGLKEKLPVKTLASIDINAMTTLITDFGASSILDSYADPIVNL